MQNGHFFYFSFTNWLKQITLNYNTHNNNQTCTAQTWLSLKVTAFGVKDLLQLFLAAAVAL